MVIPGGVSDGIEKLMNNTGHTRFKQKDFMDKTIILSTNDPTFLDEYMEPLKKFGYCIEVCHDGETTLEKVKQL